MIRFIDLRSQIYISDYSSVVFAFFDTIVDRFIEFDGEQCWGSRQEFIDAYKADPKSKPSGSRPLHRFISLMPEWVTEGEEKEKEESR